MRRFPVVVPALLAAFFGAYVIVFALDRDWTLTLKIAVIWMHLLGVVAAALAVQVHRTVHRLPGKTALVLGLGLLGMSLSNWGVVISYNSLFGPPVPPWLGRSTVVAHVAGLALLVRFATQFPARLTRATIPATLGWHWGNRRIGDAVARWLQLAILYGGEIIVAAVAGAVLFLAAIEWRFLPDPFELFTAIAVLMIAFTLRTGYVAADAEGRRRIRWIMLGFVVAAAMFALYLPLEVLRETGVLPLPDWRFIPHDAAVTAALACLAVAIFYRGDLDPSAAIQRTAVISATISLAIFSFALVQDIIVSRVAAWLGVNDTTIGALFGVLIGYSMRWLQGVLNALASRWQGVTPP